MVQDAQPDGAAALSSSPSRRREAAAAGAKRAAETAWDLARREAGVVVALLLAASAAWLFLTVAGEVTDGDAAGFDRRMLLALRADDPGVPVGPHWLRIAAADLTALGSITVLALLVALVAIWMVILRQRREALLVLLASGGGLLVSQALKQLFGRERPDVAFRAVEAMNPSFPSGHAMLSAAVFLTLGVLAARHAPKRRLKALLVGAAVALTLLVGMTRVYLGVHWPSDVLAGWSLGAGWAMACWLLLWAWERPWRGRPGEP